MIQPLFLIISIVLFLHCKTDAGWCSPCCVDCNTVDWDELDTLSPGVVKWTAYDPIIPGLNRITVDTIYESTLSDSLVSLYRNHDLVFIGSFDSTVCDSGNNSLWSGQWVYFTVHQTLKGRIDSNHTHIPVTYLELGAMKNQRFIVFINTLDSLFTHDSVWGGLGSTFLCLSATIRTGGLFLTSQNQIIKTGHYRLPGVSVSLEKFLLLTASEHSMPIVQNSISLSPNPFNPITTLRFAYPVSGGVLSIMDIQGRIMVNSKFSQGQTFTLNFQSFSSGLYLLNATTGNSNYHKALILRK